VEVVSDDLVTLRDALLAFRAERDWEQFHTPRNLAASVSIEAAEVLEHFQWLRDGEALTEQQRAEVGRELADVFIYLLLLANDLDIDLASVTASKIEENAVRFPIEESKGKARSNRPQTSLD
jgi:dCTP diphosphatase